MYTKIEECKSFWRGGNYKRILQVDIKPIYIYEKLFNIIFDKGLVPHIWLIGTIKPIFIVLVKKNSEPSSVKIFFSHEKESKKNVYYHVEQKYIFSAKMQNLIFFSVR